jgi:predicted enzyme involved in methoxymalonyl-ACP biosynthesis
METLFIVGSSYLLPSHKAWINLKASYAETKFYEYGDFISAIEDTPSDAPLALVIFFQDLFPVYAIDSRSIESAVESLLGLLQRRLHDASAETLICYADQDIQSPISSARNMPSRTVAYERFREAVDQIVQTSSTAYKLDLGSIFAKIGEDLVYDTRNWYLAHSRLSGEGVAKLVETIQEVCTRIKSPAKKILVLDCDNTLWGGVVGEDGLSGIKLGQDGIGQAFVDFQRAVKQVAAQGTLLAVCSKNNEADVMSVFEQHHAMVLKTEDIVAWKSSTPGTAQGRGT